MDKCLAKNVIYKCNVLSDHQIAEASYIGLTENSFKDRLYKHHNSFKYESKANSTEMSKQVWDVKLWKINRIHELVDCRSCLTVPKWTENL